jgi:hypothetical protein
MDILKASELFYKCAQLTTNPAPIPAPTTQSVKLTNALNNIKTISNVLADPHVHEDLSIGLIYTLDYKIKQIYQAEIKQVVTPGVNPPQKLISNQMLQHLLSLSNGIRLYYGVLAIQPIDINNLSNSFNTFKGVWDNFRNNDMNDNWMSMILKQNDQNIQNWWKKLRQKIDDSMKFIEGKITEAKTFKVPITT